MKSYQQPVLYPEFFGKLFVCFDLSFLGNATIAGTEVKISKIGFSGSVETDVLASLLYNSCTSSLPPFFIIKLVFFLLAYIISRKALLLKVKKMLFQSFLFRFEKNFFESYLLLISLFFQDRKDKQITF